MKIVPCPATSHIFCNIFFLVVCFITSVPRTGPDMAPIAAAPVTGLKVPSIVRFDKIATLDRSVIAGKLGPASQAMLHRLG
jgi:mRNA interferase MazF